MHAFLSLSTSADDPLPSLNIAIWLAIVLAYMEVIKSATNQNQRMFKKYNQRAGLIFDLSLSSDFEMCDILALKFTNISGPDSSYIYIVFLTNAENYYVWLSLTIIISLTYALQSTFGALMQLILVQATSFLYINIQCKIYL